MVKLFLKNGITALIEGGWIQPEYASKIKKDYPEEFFAVFCGYQNITAEDRLNDLRSRSSSHYLTTSNDIIGLTKQIEHSKSYQDRCEKYKFDFYDFSNIEAGSTQLKRSIENWYNNLEV